MELLNNQKGFVGSIGDDLPSLIPLTFALLVFFSALGFAFNEFDAKQTNFDQKLLALKVASILKADSFINDYEQFKLHCMSVNVVGYKFRAGLYDLVSPTGVKSVRIFDDVNPADAASLFSDGSTPPNEYQCPNSSSEPLFFRKLGSQKPEVVSYPVAVNVGTQIKTGMLVVVVWR